MGPKPIATCSHAFSRALRGLHVFASDCDWFVALFAAFVIGQNDYFASGFTTLSCKPLEPFINRIILKTLA